MFRWLRENISARVGLVVILAGLSALAVGTLTALRLVGTDKEASLVEGVVDLATQRAEGVRHRVTLGRAELRAVVLAVETDHILEVPRLAESSAEAIIATRAGEEVLEVSTDEAALAALRAAAVPADAEMSQVGDAIVIRERSGDVEALAFVDLSALLGAHHDWNVELIDIEEAPDAARGVMATRYHAGEDERARAVAVTAAGLAVRVDAPLAPAREAALGISRRMLLWSWISLIPLFLLAWLLSRAVTRPIASLAETVRDHRPDEKLALPALPPDEIGQLANAIASMDERLRDHLSALRAAVRFGRREAVQDPKDELDHLRAALSGSGSKWEVVPTRAAELEKELADAGVDRVERDAPADEAESMIRFEDGTQIFSLAYGESDHGSVIGRDTPDERDVRVAELLARTTVERLRRLELTQKSLVNEKLTVLGTLSASVAHEMNTPLAYMLANLHALERETSGEALEMVKDARLGAERLTRIVRDLSGISSGGSAIVAEEVEARDLAAHVARVCRAQGDPRNIVIEAEGPVYAFCDRGRIEQVLLNLVNNALQALEGRDDAKVVIAVHASDHDVRFEVRDNGSGIPEDAQPKLFDAFFTTKGRYGTGLGLYLSRSFVEMHGGTLELVSTGPEGTTFSITLPRDLDAGRDEPLARRRAFSSLPPASPEAERPRILIVDDEPAVLRAMKRWLGRRAEVNGTTDANRALELVAEGAEFDLILCDLDMPKMNGREFVAALREASPDLAERVVIVTGSIGEPPDGLPVVRKPLTPEKFSELLRSI